MVFCKNLSDDLDAQGGEAPLWPVSPLEKSICRAQRLRKASAGLPNSPNTFAAQRLFGTQSIVRRLAHADPMPPGGLQARLDGMDTKATRLDQVTDGIFTNLVDADILQRRISELRQVTQNEVDFRQALWSLLKVEAIHDQAKPIIMRRAVQWYQARIGTKAFAR
jgi:hypothetical protein